MPGGNQFQVDVLTLHPSQAETADGNGDNIQNSESARAISVFVDVTVVSGTTPSMDVIVETSIEGDAGPFVEQDRISAIIATGAFTATINRADDALGIRIRIRFVITGTTPSFTFEAKMERME